MSQILMPRLSDTMEEGTIARWLKQPGDQITRGDVVAEIETDKATMDLEAYESGVLEQILVPEGSTAAIGEPVAEIGDGSGSAGAPAAAGSVSARATDAVPVPAPAPERAADERTAGEPPAGEAAVIAGAAAPTPAGDPPDIPARTGGSLRTSPLARSLARRAGIDLGSLAGSGPGGRIVRADVESAIAQPGGGQLANGQLANGQLAPSAQPGASQATAGEDDEVVPLSTMRRLTAERLTESAKAPHFSLTTVVEADALLRLRAELNASLPEGAGKVTVTDLLVKACAAVLRARPEVNASWATDAIVRHRRVHVGVAVAVPDGLVVPVIRDADRATLGEIARQARDLAERARSRRLSPDELGGGTFTISNLGMLGIDEFTAIINPPQVAILAVGAAGPQPVVRDGEVVVRTTMKLTLSVDHRVLDGAMGAQFLADLRVLLEAPLRILA
ncbi:MAG: dihydrolipoamide acetyltransferase family protein [Acidimicrobiales bacterium]